MKTLLKSFNLSNKAIRIYLEGLGKYPYTFNEIQNIIPDLSKKEVKDILDELIEKKLILLLNPKYSESVSHYAIIPPFSAMLNSITELSELSEDKDVKKLHKDLRLERFQEAIYQDIENISGDLVDVISIQENSTQTIKILSEVEDNVKKFARVILNDVIGLISPLKTQSGVDARDLGKLINLVKQKITESEEIASNMFSQFRDIVKEMGVPDMPAQVEAFKTFIRKLGESIDKRVQEISLGIGSPSLEKIHTVEQSLYDFLTEYISSNKMLMEKIWTINSYEKIKEIISILLDKCSKDLTIIVPNIEDFIPLENFDLDYSRDLSLEQRTQNAIKEKATSKKPIGAGLSITKKQKKEIEDKLNIAAKKVAELKGFELSHDIADILAVISDVNPESIAIESIQGWLNRLLVIRKHLDSNTQYLLLENIEKWKKEYLQIKIKEIEPEEELHEELKTNISEKEPSTGIGLKVQVISSESHSNKYATAISNRANTEYLELKKNNIIAVIGDNSYLIFGIYHKTSNKPTFEISGFFTTYKPLIEIINPLIVDKISKAIYPKEIEINRGFNDVIENINDYTGKKISKRLKRLLGVVFEEDGISLDILELKLLIGKLEKLYQPLDDQMKEYLINELNKLNKKFSPLDLIYPPEFRPPILEETKGYSEAEIILLEIEPMDPEKLNNLFELLLEKIDKLRGVEIGEQIDKFIEVTLELQGYSNIIEWKNSLSNIKDTLEEPFKEKIKEDLLRWKMGILQQTQPSSIQSKEGPAEIHDSSTQTASEQDSPASIFEEDYISSGLAQSQYGDEEIISSNEDLDEVDPGVEMNSLFNDIQAKISELTGTEISKLLQNIVDIILETEGYSMALKGVKDWISKLRKIRSPLENDIKEDFKLEFLKWKEKYSTQEVETTLDFNPSFETIEESSEESRIRNGGSLNDKFNTLKQNAQTLKGDELSNELQKIADILLQTHGAIAVNVIRQWISKLRSVKEPLEDDIKDEFLAELENWKGKFV